MIFSVKIRSTGGDWVVYNNVEATSFGEAERKVRRDLSREVGIPESEFDARAYCSDHKTVWKHK